MKTNLMTNESILQAVGVTTEQLTAIKTYNATTSVNLLEDIFQKLMSFIYTQKVELANAKNPLSVLELSYSAFNNGSFNGMFSETMLPYREKDYNGGDKNLHGGKLRKSEKDLRNPYTEQEYGKEPLTFVFGINAKVERFIEYNRQAFLMALQEEQLSQFIRGVVSNIDKENIASRYIVENRVINCQEFQNVDYASASKFSTAYELDKFIKKVYRENDFNELNLAYKRTKFDTTRGSGELVLLLNGEFADEYTQRFQISNFLKPFVFKELDSDKINTERKMSRIIELPSLTPTKAVANKPYDPYTVEDVALAGESKLIGRIVDINAIKFGVGQKSAVSFPLSASISHYDEREDLCLNMCNAYTNVPLIITKDFDFDRKFVTKT